MHKLLALCLFCSIFVSSCSSKKNDNKKNVETEEQQAKAVRENVVESFRASAINVQLHTWGETFPEGLLNDVTRSHHYLQLKNQGAAAVNLGIYISDLGLAVVFNKSREVQRYFDACFLLADYVGMKKQFSKVVSLQFPEIISGNENMDGSLDRLFDNAQNTTDEFKRMHADALAGYYIEELYHLVKFAQSASADNDHQARLTSLKLVLDQSSALSNLVRYFDHLKLKPQGITVYQNFLSMQAKYLTSGIAGLRHETDPLIILQNKGFQELASQIVVTRRSITDL